MTKKLPLRPNVCILVINKNGLFLLAERTGEAGVWQFPQGGVERGYSLEENVYKELTEELGAEKKKFKIIKKLKASHKYDWRTPPSYAKGRWRGQSQKFFLVKFIGKDSDINLEKSSKELMDWRWCTVEDVKKLAEPKRLKGYLKAFNELFPE